MTIEFNCHVCGKLLRTADEKAGRTAKCPGCGESIAVPDPDETGPTDADQESAAEDYGEDDYEQDETGDDDYGRSDELAAPASRRRGGRRDCPMCGESISATAAICRFCGEDVGDAPARRGRGRRSRKPDGVEFGEVFSASWEIFSAEMGISIGAFLIIMVLNLLIVGAAFVLVIVSSAGAAGAGGDPAIGGFVLVVGIFLLVVGSMFFSAYITAGQNIFLLKLVRGENAEISDLFSGGPYLLRMLGNQLIFGLLVLIGYVLCIVPAIFVMLMLWPFSFLLVDKDLPGLDSLSRAKEITEGSWGPVFLLGLVATLIYSGAASICPIAAFFVLPWVMIMMAVVYCRLTGQRTAER